MSISADLISRMYADYSAGASLNEVARRFGRSRQSVRDAFVRRNYPIRQVCVFKHRLPNGRIAPYVSLTAEQIEALIKKSTRLRVPAELKFEWRRWPMERRGEFIARLRAHLASPHDRPSSPFSDNVTPFDYTAPEARAIVAAMNAGTNSRDARIKLDICSQGVIYKGRLWFWSHKIGYQNGPWTSEGGRQALHRVIWEETNGRPVPPAHCVVFLDGNVNNFAPENLGLLSRNENARRNQAGALLRKSRERTALLLKLSRKQKGESHENAHTFRKIREL